MENEVNKGLISLLCSVHCDYFLRVSQHHLTPGMTEEMSTITSDGTFEEHLLETVMHFPIMETI